MKVKSLLFVLFACLFSAQVNATDVAAAEGGGLTVLAPLFYKASNGFQVVSVTPETAELFVDVVERYRATATPHNVVSFDHQSFVINSEKRRVEFKNPWHLYLVQSETGATVGSVWYGRCPNTVTADNRYQKPVEKAYAALGMGTVDESGVYAPAGDYHFAHCVPVVPDSLPSEQRIGAFLAITEYAGRLAAADARLPLGGKLAQGLSVHLHPDALDVSVLSGFGFSTIQPEGVPADRWLWNVASDAVFKNDESDRRVMLVNMAIKSS